MPIYEVAALAEVGRAQVARGAIATDTVAAAPETVARTEALRVMVDWETAD